MQKKKKRMYDGGKSVLHVKNSAGGFYKVKKTGRLGKNCVHFSGRKYVPNMINGAVLQTAPVMKKGNRGLEI